MQARDVVLKARSEGISTQALLYATLEDLEQTNRDLAMLIKRLCRYLEKPELDSAEVRKSAMEYLERKGLKGSLLR